MAAAVSCLAQPRYVGGCPGREGLLQEGGASSSPLPQTGSYGRTWRCEECCVVSMASDAGRKPFWKRSVSRVPGSIQHVYGAQHPPFDPLLHRNLIKNSPKPPTPPVKKVTTFQEFESNTSDAWDAGDDDDDELLAMATESLNTKVVMETANKVIRNHSKLQEQHKVEEENLPEEITPFEEVPSIRNNDKNLVKSASESQIPCSTGGTHGKASLQRQQSVPHQPTVPLVAEVTAQDTSIRTALPEREAFRLDKFKQLLAGPSTDLVLTIYTSRPNG